MASRDSSGSRWEKEAGSCLFGVRVGRPGGKHNKPKGLLQFSALIAARDKQTKTHAQARSLGRSPGRAYPSDLNLICLLLVCFFFKRASRSSTAALLVV